MRGPSTELLFVYNAQSGPFSALADALHKLVSPETYACSLCAVTYGPLSMRRKWRGFLASLPHDKRFYHRDDFAAAYPDADFALSAILVRRSGQSPQSLVSAGELDDIPDLDQLIDLLRVRLEAVSVPG